MHRVRLRVEHQKEYWVTMYDRLERGKSSWVASTRKKAIAKADSLLDRNPSRTVYIQRDVMMRYYEPIGKRR